MKKALFGLAKSQDQALSIVNQLNGGGFADSDISVLLPDKTRSRHFAHLQRTRAPEGVAAGASLGSLVQLWVGCRGLGYWQSPGLHLSWRPTQ
jgi:hypothetical protein